MLISCDPGFEGSVAVLKDGVITMANFPTYKIERKVTSGKRKGKMSKKSYYDYTKIGDLFPEGDADFISEQVSARENDGKAQLSALLLGRGLLLGIAAARKYRIYEVLPHIWKKRLGLPTGATKEDSRQLAIKRHPELAEELKLGTMRKALIEGKAEAVLMLDYLQEFILNPTPKLPKKRVKK